MSRSIVMTGMAAGIFLSTCACTDHVGSPAAPTVAASQAAPSDESGSPSTPTHGEQLHAVVGKGSGIVNVTPTAAVDGTFSAEITVNIHGAPPNTTFYVQRAAEIDRPNGADGFCQRAAGEAPWGPPTPNFVTFPMPLAGPLATLDTAAAGAGATHIAYAPGAIPDRTRFDVMFRLVDSLTAPANELRTDCFMVTVK
jgi:hypothetical protein